MVSPFNRACRIVRLPTIVKHETLLSEEPASDHGAHRGVEGLGNADCGSRDFRLVVLVEERDADAGELWGAVWGELKVVAL